MFRKNYSIVFETEKENIEFEKMLSNYFYQEITEANFQKLIKVEKWSEESKQCSNCELTKNLSSFSKNRDAPDGYRAECKLCLKGKRIKLDTLGIESSKSNSLEENLLEWKISKQEFSDILKNNRSQTDISNAVKALIQERK